MEAGIKRRGTVRNGGVIAGSIRESRMKIDQVKGGIKVFNAQNEISGGGGGDKKTLRPKLAASVPTTNAIKRKTWKSEATPKLDSAKNVHEQLKEMTDTHQGTNKISRQNERAPIRRMRSRFEEATKEAESPAAKIQGIEKSQMQLIRVNSDINEKKAPPPLEHNSLILSDVLIKGNPMPKQIIDDTLKTDAAEEEEGEEEKGVSIRSNENMGQNESASLVQKTDSKREEIIEEKEIIIRVEEKKEKEKKKKRIHEIPETIQANLSSSSSSSKTTFNIIPQKHNRLQSLVDLVMWIDVSKSAFVFGLGTFLIVSSSCTKEVNISLISIVSYLGLVYLAVIFLSRSIIIRRGIEVADDDENYVIGEEEAMRLMKKVLPYLNEFLLKLKPLFSGDPATTMKLAVILFILARCGTSITIWKMTKFGFIGIFTLPKICYSYSTKLTGYGNFWFRRFGDAWNSCSHKKAMAFAIFTLIWNLSSVVARSWALFMLFVTFRYYKESGMMMIGEDDGRRCDRKKRRYTNG